MNILVFSWRDPKHPLAGGAEQVMHEHMKGWIEAGHSVTLFSSRIKGNSEKEEVFDGVKIKRRGIQFFGVQILGFLYYIRNSKKFDLVIDEFHGLPFFTPLYVRKSKLAVVQEVAGKVWLKNDLPRPLNWIVGLIGYLGEPFLFLLYKQSLLPGSRNVPFMTGSESAKKSLIRMGISAKNITIVPHGVIIANNEKRITKSKTKTILFLGALAKDKGVEDAIKTFKILINKNYLFWVVGRGGEGYRQYLEKLAKKLGVRVKFWGFVDDDKKFELLARAHLLINPSVLEGWGLVNIEANSVGTPVVAYNSAGLTDSVKDGMSGTLVRNNSPESLAQKIVEILNDQEAYKRLQQGAVAWSKNFSWENSRKLSLKLVEKLGHE